MSDAAVSAETVVATIKISAFDQTVLVVIPIVLGVVAAGHLGNKVRSEEPKKACGATKATACYIITI
jgi:hypothetical protein